MISRPPRCGSSPPEERARRFIRAGGDLLIVGDARLAATMADAIKREASDNPAFEKRVRDSATRVVAMKERRGLRIVEGCSRNRACESAAEPSLSLAEERTPPLTSLYIARCAR